MRLAVSSSPHQHTLGDTPWVMRQVIVALLPVIGAGIYFFKIKALFLLFNCVLSCVLTEGAVFLIRKQKSRLSDCSAVVTGLILALVLPPSTAWYAATLGSVVAIAVGKQIFGGLGQNIFNPALVGRAFLAAAYPKMLTTWTTPLTLDAVTKATPLALRKFDAILTPLKDLFFGFVPGSLGETSAVCILIGGIYLLVRKIGDWRTPLSYIFTSLLIATGFYLIDPSKGMPLFHIFSGGLLLGAFFITTDPVTTPSTKAGRYWFGIGCAVLTMIIRYFSGLPGGVMYAILFMNALTPLINRYTIPKPFGYLAQVQD